MTLKWSTLRRLASSQYAKLTVLVPIIGWLLVLNDQAAKILSSATGVADIAPPSWKIYSLHVGLSLFGLGVGAFYLFCPSAIKDHENFNAFCASESKTITGDRLALYAAKCGASLEESSDELAIAAANPRHERDLWYSRNLGQILEVFSKYYEHSDISAARFWKGITFLLFIIGGLVTLIPSIITVLWSLGRIGKILFG
jgi:hypothetical protein